jgi:hypothetical protein
MTKQAYSIAEFVETFGCSRSVAYEQLQAGKLRAHKLGGRTLIFLEDALAWRDALPLLPPKVRATEAA